MANALGVGEARGRSAEGGWFAWQKKDSSAQSQLLFYSRDFPQAAMTLHPLHVVALFPEYSSIFWPGTLTLLFACYLALDAPVPICPAWMALPCPQVPSHVRLPSSHYIALSLCTGILLQCNPGSSVGKRLNLVMALAWNSTLGGKLESSFRFQGPH